MSTKPPIAIRLIHSEDASFIATRDSTACYTFKQDSIRHDPIKALQRIAELMGLDVNIAELSQNKNMVQGEIIVGNTYIAYNQGTNITPLEKEVTVVWIDSRLVHYRLEDETFINETTIERFKEICRI